MAWHNRLFNLFRRERLSREVTKELDFHVTERTDDLVASGIPPREAQRQARRQFGSYALHKEDTWMSDLAGWLESLGADLRYALRGFVKSPGFTIVAILSLALGIGANTAIFSLIDAAMLRDLPVRHPEALQQLRSQGSPYFSNPLWEQIRDHQDLFSSVFAWNGTRFNLAPGGETRYINADWVSGDFFATLGLGTALGRPIVASDDRRGCPGVAVLSHAFWMKEYGGSSSVIGKRISFDTHPFEIIGVAQPGFTGLDVGRSEDAFVPLCSETVIRGATGSGLDRRSWRWIRIVGRPKPGVNAAQMKAHLEMLSPTVFTATIPEKWSAEQQQSYTKRTLTSKPASETLSGKNNEMFQPLKVLMAVVGMVLLIACANVANLMLARATVRQREMAVRMALGAGRARLIRQMLTESLLLSLAGAALGLLFAQWGSRLLTMMISTTGNTVWLDLSLHPRLLLFTAAAGTATGVLFGMLPAWRSARVAPIAAMKAQGRGVTEGGSRMRLGKVLVVAQVAISMVLVAGAALMLTTFHNLVTLDPGFRSQGVLLASAGLRGANIAKEHQDAAIGDILNRLRAIPGVRAASMSDMTPIGNMTWNEVIKFDGQALRPGDEAMVFFNAVSDGFLQTLGMQLVAGRDFTPSDNEASQQVALVSEATARRFFGKASPLGRVFTVDEGKAFGHPRVIVGVVRDHRYHELRTEPPATAFIPYAQRERAMGMGMYPSFEVRGAASPLGLVPAVREAVAAVSPAITLDFIPLATQVNESLNQERLLATLSSFFGGLALLLAAIGLYGVLSYNVARRRNEIGVRMALGAAQARVLRMVLGEAGWLAGIGLGLGIAGTLAATQLVSAFLYGVRPDDPPTLGSAAAVLGAIAALAAYLPARRAAMVDPMTALREE
jgi:putative ABC transport system permease protein